MNMLVEELQLLANDPKAWIVVLVLAGFALHSVIGAIMCPYVKGTATFTPEDIREAQGHEFNPGVRFALMMIGGIVLMLAGLFMIAGGIKPALALALLVTGIVVTQTEPMRLQIREQKFGVVAAQGARADVLATAQDRLHAHHRALAWTNAAMLFAVTGALLAF